MCLQPYFLRTSVFKRIQERSMQSLKQRKFLVWPFFIQILHCAWVLWRQWLGLLPETAQDDQWEGSAHGDHASRIGSVLPQLTASARYPLRFKTRFVFCDSYKLHLRLTTVLFFNNVNSYNIYRLFTWRFFCCSILSKGTFSVLRVLLGKCLVVPKFELRGLEAYLFVLDFMNYFKFKQLINHSFTWTKLWSKFFVVTQ